MEKSATKSPEELHPLVREFQRLASKKSPDRLDKGLIRIPRDAALSIKVSPESLPRAIHIVNTILRCTDAKGWDTSIGKGYSGYETQINIDGVKVSIELNEKLRLQKRVPRKEDKYFWDGNDWVPTGALNLRITNANSSGVRQNWKDGKKRKLENVVDGFIIGLQKAALHIKERRIIDEERNRLRMEEQRRLEQAKNRLYLEEQAFEDLKLKVSNWNISNQIQGYLGDLLKHFESRQDVLNNPKFQDWLRWARRYAEELKVPRDFNIPIVSNFSEGK